MAAAASPPHRMQTRSANAGSESGSPEGGAAAAPAGVPVLPRDVLDAARAHLRNFDEETHTFSSATPVAALLAFLGVKSKRGVNKPELLAAARQRLGLSDHVVLSSHRSPVAVAKPTKKAAGDAAARAPAPADVEPRAPWATERLAFHVWLHVGCFLDAEGLDAAARVCRDLRAVFLSAHMWDLRLHAVLCAAPPVTKLDDADAVSRHVAPRRFPAASEAAVRARVSSDSPAELKRRLKLAGLDVDAASVDDASERTDEEHWRRVRRAVLLLPFLSQPQPNSDDSSSPFDARGNGEHTFLPPEVLRLAGVFGPTPWRDVLRLHCRWSFRSRSEASHDSFRDTRSSAGGLSLGRDLDSFHVSQPRSKARTNESQRGRLRGEYEARRVVARARFVTGAAVRWMLLPYTVATAEALTARNEAFVVAIVAAIGAGMCYFQRFAHWINPELTVMLPVKPKTGDKWMSD